MYTIVKKHTINFGASAPSASSTYAEERKAKEKFYEFMKNYSADRSVTSCRVVLMDDDLRTIKTDGFDEPAPIEEVAPGDVE